MKGANTANIIGAGPAGLTAAIVLRRHGFSVTVFEMAPDVGHRLNGDFQGLENWSSEEDITDLMKGMGLEINFLCVPWYGGSAYAPEAGFVKITSPRPLFYLVKRGGEPGAIDSGLKEQALSLGAKILFNNRVDTLAEKAIVGTGPKGAYAVAAGMTFTTSMEDQAVAVFDNAVAPKGYAYLLVHQGDGTLATTLFRDYGRGKECFQRTIEFFRKHVRLDVRNEKKFTSCVNFFLRDSQIHGQCLYVGESAGFQDALWGFGMRYAIVSGYLAAKSLIEGLNYDALWKRELKPMLETSLVNRYLFERFDHSGYRYLTKKFAQGNPCDFLRRQYNYSLFKQLLLPLAKKKYERTVIDKHLVANPSLD